MEMEAKCLPKKQKRNLNIKVSQLYLSQPQIRSYKKELEGQHNLLKEAELKQGPRKTQRRKEVPPPPISHFQMSKRARSQREEILDLGHDLDE